MNRAEAQTWLLNQLEEWKAAKLALAEARATMEGSRLIVQGILKRFPDLEARVDMTGTTDDPWESGEKPRGSEAVLQVLQVMEDEWFSVNDMVLALDARGWLPESENPANAVRTALERLVAQAGSNVHKGRNQASGGIVYRYHEVDEEPPF